MTKKPIVSPSFLRQRAKQIKKEKSITLARAYDEAAREHGFSNYRNYLNLSEAGRKETKPTEADLLRSLSSEKQTAISKSLNPINSRILALKTRIQEILGHFQQSPPSGEVMQAICEKHVELKEYIELHLIADSLRDEGGEIDSYAPYHIAKEILLEDLIYKMEGGLLCAEGDYDLKLAFAHVHDPADKDDFFDDRELSGSFELTIDSNGGISFEHQDIGHLW